MTTTIRVCAAALLAALPLTLDAETGHPRSSFSPGSMSSSRSVDAHRSIVRSIAFSADGRTFATLGGERSIKIWSIGSCEPVRTLTGTFQPQGVALSSDGRLVVAQEGNAIVAIDVQKDERVARIENVPTRVFALSPDGKRVVTSTRAARTTIYNLQSGEELLAFSGANRYSRALAWSKDGKRIAEIGTDRVARLWDAEKGEELFQFENTGVNAFVQTFDMQFSPDGKLLAAALYDGSARIFDAINGKELLTERTAGGHRAVAFSRDGRYLATGHQDGSIRIWDVKTGRELRKVSAHQGGVATLAFTPNGRGLVSGGNDGKVTFWGQGSSVVAPSKPERSGKPGFLGITGQDGADGKGVEVTSVIDGSAAQQAGLKDGDVILSVSGKDVSTFEDLRALISGMKEGDEVELKIQRDGAEQKLKGKLGSRPTE